MENRENKNVHMEKRNEYWLAVSDSCWLWRMKCDENVKPTGGTLLPIRELNCSSIKNKSKKLRYSIPEKQLFNKSMQFSGLSIIHCKKRIAYLCKAKYQF
ncbi:hypothetical protein T4B_6858 [Trichinella pseudospiralis]|uniref:Uncharacterized protein n=1 Tax=Trichinella pseudospiralis TaxID=6337 RepID=A0A0V1J2J0_TRIPS|nr:hypothetical protein T4B_6858 [Trichinella pseudospiralis]